MAKDARETEGGSMTTADLRRRALAELGISLRRLPSGGYVARGAGALTGRHDVVARDERELAEVLRRWLGMTA
jgi:hypothetical protein